MIRWRMVRHAVLSFFGLGVVWFAVVTLPLWIVHSRHELFPLTMGSMRTIGWIPIAFGAAIILWCYGLFVVIGNGTPWPFDPPSKLVVVGPYRVVRNPMESSALLIIFGEMILLESSVLLLYLGVGFLFLYLRQVLIEEPALRVRFGKPYDEYCRSVPRYIPLL